jgi:transcription elongation factor/antiterminator RfaH
MNFVESNTGVSTRFRTQPWYGIRTKSNHEKLAARVLESKGYEQYLPVYRSRRRWSDRVVEKDRPLFPGYVFCRFDARKSLPIVSTPGVVSVVGFGNEPAPIADTEIEAVQMLLQSGLATEPCPFLQEGQRIRVKRGALEGLEGILLKKKTNWRIVVSVTMLQRSVAVEIDREWIDSIS